MAGMGITNPSKTEIILVNHSDRSLYKSLSVSTESINLFLSIKRPSIDSQLEEYPQLAS
jgi:hypothetical protein